MAKLRIDLTDQRFGRLTVLGIGHHIARGDALWQCQCICGDTKLISGISLRHGRTLSCGCLQREKAKITASKKIIDLSGKRFGRLLVLKRSDDMAPNCPGWECRCDCGTVVRVWGQNLRGRLTASCGCLRIEKTRERFTRHGKGHQRKSPEYYIWGTMIQRCENPKNKNYHRYGGRGISVCAQWHDFPNFYADMGDRPTPLHTLERVDNGGPYCKDNCSWATRVRQANNRTSNRLIDFRGEQLTLREIFLRTGCEMRFDTVRSRVFQAGWSIEDALSRPLHGR